MANGVDLSVTKKAQKAADTQETETFEIIAREWHGKFAPSWSTSHADKIIRRFELYVFPWIGSKPIKSITTQELLTVLRRIEAKGILETAYRTQQNCGRVFRYTVATGRAERDPSGDLRGALPPANGKHMATITDPKEIVACSGLLPTTRVVLLHDVLYALHHWSLFALVRQAREILQEIRHGRFVFPSPHTDMRPMSNNAVLAALRCMGYAKEEMSGHRFRSGQYPVERAEMENRNAIEHQLAHAERNSIRASYNFADVPERREMMQHWADYLDRLVNREGNKITQDTCAT